MRRSVKNKLKGHVINTNRMERVWRDKSPNNVDN